MQWKPNVSRYQVKKAVDLNIMVFDDKASSREVTTRLVNFAGNVMKNEESEYEYGTPEQFGSLRTMIVPPQATIAIDFSSVVFPLTSIYMADALGLYWPDGILRYFLVDLKGCLPWNKELLIIFVDEYNKYLLGSA